MLKFVEELLQGERVEWKRLGEISKFYGGLTGKNKHDFENGRAAYIPYKNIFDNLEINPEQIGRVNITAEEHQNEIMRGDVLFTASSETPEEVGMSSAVTKSFLEPVYLNSFSFGMRFTSEVKLLPEFSKYLFRSSFVRGQIIKTASGVTRFNISKKLFKNILIPIPPLRVQEKIVEVLDKYTALEEELEAKLKIELALRKKQYEYYRNKLLTFGEEVEWKTLGEVALIRRGKRLVKKDLEPSGQFAVFQNSMQPLGFYDAKNVEGDTAFVISAGSAGEIGYSDVPFWAADDVYYFVPKENLKSKYLYYSLLNQQNTIKSQVRRASVPRLSRIVIEDLAILIPPLSEQARIVGILDKFDTLVNSLCEGLPREIELRHKQYEYYRDQLLTFPAPE